MLSAAPSVGSKHLSFPAGVSPVERAQWSLSCLTRFRVFRGTRQASDPAGESTFLVSRSLRRGTERKKSFSCLSCFRVFRGQRRKPATLRLKGASRRSSSGGLLLRVPLPGSARRSRCARLPAVTKRPSRNCGQQRQTISCTRRSDIWVTVQGRSMQSIRQGPFRVSVGWRAVQPGRRRAKNWSDFVERSGSAAAIGWVPAPAAVTFSPIG